MADSTTWLVYQPLIVGLGAVVLATLGSTLLEWYRHYLRDARDARALRTAFLEELRAHRRMIECAISPEQREEEQGAFMIPLDTFFPVYENMIGRIGLLAPPEAAAILQAYANLFLLPKNLAILGKIQRDEFSSWAIVEVKHKDLLINMNDTLLRELDAAISRLSGTTPEQAVLRHAADEP